MQPKRHYALFPVFVLLSDVASIALSYLFAFVFRFATFEAPFGVPPLDLYVKAFGAVVVVYVVVFHSCGLYSTLVSLRPLEEAFQVAKASVLATLVLMSITFVYRTEITYSRAVLFIAWCFSVFLISFLRFELNRFERHLKANRGDVTRLVVVGINRYARELIRWVKETPHSGYALVGVISEHAVAAEPALAGARAGRAPHTEMASVHEPGQDLHVSGAPVLTSLDDFLGQFQEHVDRYKIEEVVLTTSSLPKERVTDLILKCEGGMVPFRVVADFYGLITSGVQVEYISRVPFLGVKELPLDDFTNRLLKRTFDVVSSALALLVCLPLFAAVAVAIKLQDRGPVFYRQERVGRDGRVFTLCKFRTMAEDAERETGPVWAQADDVRRTTVGEWLRRSNVDELPQLWNVLRGNMSLVGPRPERPHFVEQFKESVPRYMSRHKVKSGITGWAQVNGLRGRTSLADRVKYDLYYMENWSLLFDIEILVMTLFAFRNAY